MNGLSARLLWSLFGIPSVILYDHDGDWRIRRVRFAGEKPYAARYSSINCNVFLDADGKCRGVSFVTKWEPALPLEPVWHPQWQRGEVVPLHAGETVAATSDPVGFPDEQVK